MKIMVMIPTYNERENIKDLVNEILSLKSEISVVVVDDNSPDGTSILVREMADKEPRIHLITRVNEKGRGTAGLKGMLYAIEQGADYIIEMDSDWSHHPKYIPDMLKLNEKYDVVIGSRLTEGGGEEGRGFDRRFITWFANTYIRLVMGFKVKDCTSGYRSFKRKVLETVNLKEMISVGPSIVEEILYAAHLNGFSIVELPIWFEERRMGNSTKDLQQYMDTMWKVLQFRFQRKKFIRNKK
jgi:dolichol-phosphate mannosyltransferase